MDTCFNDFLKWFFSRIIPLKQFFLYFSNFFVFGSKTIFWIGLTILFTWFLLVFVPFPPNPSTFLILPMLLIFLRLIEKLTLFLILKKALFMPQAYLPFWVHSIANKMKNLTSFRSIKVINKIFLFPFFSAKLP